MCSFLFFSNLVIVHLSNWVEEYPSFQQSAVNIFFFSKSLKLMCQGLHLGIILVGSRCLMKVVSIGTLQQLVCKVASVT